MQECAFKGREPVAVNHKGGSANADNNRDNQTHTQTSLLRCGHHPARAWVALDLCVPAPEPPHRCCLSPVVCVYVYVCICVWVCMSKGVMSIRRSVSFGSERCAMQLSIHACPEDDDVDILAKYISGLGRYVDI